MSSMDNGQRIICWTAAICSLTAALAVFVVLLFPAVGAADTGAFSIEQQAGEDHQQRVLPAERTVGDVSVFAFVDGHQFADGPFADPLYGVSAGARANFHFSPYAAGTVRAGVVTTADELIASAAPGIRGQLPLGRTTLGAGVHFGVWVGGPDVWLPGAEMNWEYSFDSGLSLGLDAGVDIVRPTNELAPRVGVRVGWDNSLWP